MERWNPDQGPSEWARTFRALRATRRKQDPINVRWLQAHCNFSTIAQTVFGQTEAPTYTTIGERVVSVLARDAAFCGGACLAILVAFKATQAVGREVDPGGAACAILATLC